MRKKIWTAEEDHFIRDNQHLTNDELSTKTGSTGRALNQRHKFLGINRPTGRLEVNRYRHKILRESHRSTVPEDWFELPATRKDAKDTDSKWYWQGTICTKCSKTTIRNTATGNCWPCFAALCSTAKKTPEGRKRHREYALKFRRRNPNHCRDIARQKYANPDERAILLERARRWRSNNKEYFKRHNRNWSIANPDHRAQIKDARRARKLGAEVELTPKEKLRVRHIKRRRRLINQRAGRQAAHVDHLLPLTQGGTNHPDNLQIITASSNLFWKDKIKMCPYPKPLKWNEPIWEIDS